MAGNGKKKEQQQIERVVPGIAAGKASRVSKAAGSVGSSRARAEQRASPGTPKPRSNGRPAPSGRSKAVSKKTPTPSATPADSRMIGQVRDRWGEMQPHEQQRLVSVMLLILASLLFFALTFWRTSLVFKPLAEFFFSMFSWMAVPLTLGLIAFAVAHLIEGMRNIRFIRWSLVMGLFILLILLLVESQLLGGRTTGGIIGGVLATIIVQLGFGAHVLVIGLLIVTILLTFRITLSQLQIALQWLMQVFVAPRTPSATGESHVSPFWGQRPRYSRYGSSQPDEPGASLHPRTSLDTDEDENDAVVVFEDDFDAELDDPHNGTKLRKAQVSNVAKGPRPPLASNPAELRANVKNMHQLPLPETPEHGAVELEQMEALVPNPRRAKPAEPVIAPQLKVSRRGAVPVDDSPWTQPDSSLLNTPEDVKLQLRGEDTNALAKTIQDTLRSFRVDAEVRPEDISIGPTVIRFGIRPTGTPLLKEDGLTPVKDASGNIVYEKRTRVSRIMALQNDLALVLESKTIRMEAPVPGRPYVGVEIPNKNSRMVTLREILESKEYQAARAKSKLSVALGKDVAGAVRVGDLAKMPHLLIAGATGAGKCLAYGEPVFLADGRIVHVQDLIDRTEQVIGVTDTETMRQVPVAATFADNGLQQVFELELAHGIILRRTGEHPLWALNLATASAHTGCAGWVTASKLTACYLTAGHALLCPLNLYPYTQTTVDDAQPATNCPPGYAWRKILAIRQSSLPTINIEVHSDNHAFVGYAVEHNSVMINTIIASVITQATPDDVRMLMVDPKMVELSMYNGIPHLLSPVVIEVEKVVGLLKIAIAEMERRYKLFSQLSVRNLDGYRRLRTEKIAQGDETLKNLPAIVIIIDELADLMMAAPEEVEGLICRLAQLARATGIHLVVATQRPSVDVITGLIKANIPTRISFMVSSAVDSRTIIDMGGAERLLGRGDMLYLPADAGKPERVQGAFVADEEVERLVTYWREQAATHAAQAAAHAQGQNSTPGAAIPGIEPGWEVNPQANEEFELDDELLEQAEQVVQDYERASISLLQRRLRIGYSRAARLIDLLEERGVISKAEAGGRSREVLEPRSSSRHSPGEGHSMAAEAADILEEEKRRAEFLKKQAERERLNQLPHLSEDL